MKSAVSSTSRNSARPLEWSALADRDLFDAWAYIYKENQAAADQVVKRIHQAAGRLATHPLIGTLSGYHHTRALPVARTPFTLYYRVTARRVIIVRLVHQRQNFPK